MSEFDKWINKNYSGSFDMPHQRDCFEAGQQSQQHIIDNLIFQAANMKSRLNDNYTAGQTSMYLTKQPKIDELQARIDEVISILDRGICHVGSEKIFNILKGNKDGN